LRRHQIAGDREPAHGDEHTDPDHAQGPVSESLGIFIREGYRKLGLHSDGTKAQRRAALSGVAFTPQFDFH
jgi:hypothetical protein